LIVRIESGDIFSFSKRSYTSAVAD